MLYLEKMSKSVLTIAGRIVVIPNSPRKKTTTVVKIVVNVVDMVFTPFICFYKITVNVLTCPGALCTSTAPPCSSAIRLTIASPRPLPGLDWDASS